MVPSLHMASSSPSSSFLVTMSSLTHSIIRSASAAADFSSTSTLAIRASLAAWSILPLSTRFWRDLSRLSLCRWAETTLLAYIRAVWPLAAKTWAMPLPMVPAPKIATFITVSS